MKKLQNQITNALTATKRPGMDNLIEWLIADGFFTSPASTRFHGCYPGGLAQHSWDVYQNLQCICMSLGSIGEPINSGQRPYPVYPNNIVIAALLHDINKVGYYVPTTGKYKYRTNRDHPKGHGELSITFASKHIILEPIEIVMIRFHMGIYGTFELGDYCAEYPLKNEESKKKYKPKSKMSAAELADKEADQAKRYCTSLRNCWYHNPICKFLSIADELATMEAKCKDYRENKDGDG